MARQRNVVEDKQVDELKEAVVKRYGKPLTHSFECELLSKEIEKVTKIYISPQTLRRLFGFLNAEFSPSVRTLNNLSLYAGFDDFHGFINNTNETAFQPLTINEEASLYLEFYNLEMKPEADMNFHNACRGIAWRIVNSTSLLTKLAPALSENKVSQIYFFERFPYIDGLCSDYLNSFKLYQKKKGNEAQLFSNTLLFFSAFMSGNHSEFSNHIKQINKVALTESIHPFVIARYIGSNILFNSSEGVSISGWVAEAKKWSKYFLQRSETSFWRFPHFQFMICDYLNLAGYYKESYSILRTINILSKNYENEAGYNEALEIIFEIAKHPVSPEGYILWFEKTTAFNTINPFFEKHFALQSHCLYYSLLRNGKRKQNIKRRIEDLIRITNFTYFRKFIANEEV